MGEIDHKPYTFAWESEQRDCCGTRIVKFRICFPWRVTNRWSRRVFKTEQAAQAFIDAHF